MYKNDGVTRRYSEGFKLKILAELSTGNYSKRQLGMIYGINRTTINEWIKKYDELNWENATGYSEGTKRKVLRDDKNKGQTILLKLPEGFYMAPHSHITAEQHFVIEGEYPSGGESYPAGSYQVFSPEEEHGSFESKKGALILIVWDPIQVAQ